MNKINVNFYDTKWAVVVQTLYHENPEPLWGFSRFHLMSMLPKTEDFSFF